MDSYRNCINLKRVIFINFDKEFDHTIKNILNKIFDIYYLERDVQLYILIIYLKNVIWICMIYCLKIYINQI